MQKEKLFGNCRSITEFEKIKTIGKKILFIKGKELTE